MIHFNVWWLFVLFWSFYFWIVPWTLVGGKDNPVSYVSRVIFFLLLTLFFFIHSVRILIWAGALKF